MRNIIIGAIFFICAISHTQNHTLGLGINHFNNICLNYEIETSKSYNLKLSISRNLTNGKQSKKKTTYNFSSLSAKIFSGDIWDFEIYHGPGILIGYYYEYKNFRNNTTYYPVQLNNESNYQSSSMTSIQYNIGVERSILDNMKISGELAAGTHFLFNDNMTILERYNLGNLVPYIFLNIYVGYNF